MKFSICPGLSVLTCLLFAPPLSSRLHAQDNHGLEQLFRDLVEILDSESSAGKPSPGNARDLMPREPSEDNAKQNEARPQLRRLLKIARQGASEVIRMLPEESQQAISDQRRELMDALASGVDDLTGEDIEKWLESSDNVILQSLARNEGENVNVQGIVQRLKQQWWYGKEESRLAGLLTQRPVTISRGTQYSGRPVIYINGITTTRNAAIEMADKIAEQLSRPVRLLHNPTFLEEPWTTGLNVKGYGNDDLSETFYDRIWPTTIINRLNRLDSDQLQQMVLANEANQTKAKATNQDEQTSQEGRASQEGKAGQSGLLQGNPTTAQLTHILLHSTEPVDLVTHSQGCIIARNAMFSLAMLGKTKTVRKRIAWIACGVPMSESEITPQPLQFTMLNDANDLVAQVSSLRGNVDALQRGTHSFINTYCPQLEPRMLWHALPARKAKGTRKPDPVDEASKPLKPDVPGSSQRVEL